MPGVPIPCAACDGLGRLTDGRRGNGAADPALVCQACGGTGTARPTVLVVAVDVPEGVSEDDLLAAVERICLAADDEHRAAGGHGLRVRSVKILEDAPPENDDAGRPV